MTWLRLSATASPHARVLTLLYEFLVLHGLVEVVIPALKQAASTINITTAQMLVSGALHFQCVTI